jgi:hypothetical protein
MLSPLNLSHQVHLIDPMQVQPATVIGVGSVGSQVVEFLADSGVTDITVYDDDRVESHNCPMSSYGREDTGLLKVHALSVRVLRDVGITLKARAERFECQTLSGTVIACVDSMSARSQIWAHVEGNPRCNLFCDTRTHGAYIECYVVDPHTKEECEEYRKSLYSDAESLRQSCGYHGVRYATAAVASAVVSQVCQFWQTGTKKAWHAERRDILVNVN